MFAPLQDALVSPIDHRWLYREPTEAEIQDYISNEADLPLARSGAPPDDWISRYLVAHRRNIEHCFLVRLWEVDHLARC